MSAGFAATPFGRPWALVAALALWPGSALGQARVQKLNAPLFRPVLGDVREARFAAGGAFVVYRADQDVDERVDLFVLPAHGGRPPLRLNRPEDGSVAQFELSTRGALVVYLAGQNLFSVPLDRSREPRSIGSAAARAGEVAPFVLSPDQLHVAYRADADGDGDLDLLLGTIDGSAPPRRLSGDVDNPGLPLFSPDGTRIAFLAPVLGRLALFGALVDAAPGTQPVRLSGTPVADARGNYRFLFSPDGTRVVYSYDERQRDRFELFVVPSDGSAAPLVLHPTSTGGYGVNFFEIDPLGVRVVYVADHDRATTFELYSVPLDGSLPPRKLHAALGGARDVSRFQILPDGTALVFNAELDTEGLNELYAVPVDGSEAPRKLNSQPLTVGEFAFVPEAGRVVYRGRILDPWSEQLLGVALDDPDDTLVYAEAGGAITSFLCTPDGQSVVFRRSTGASTSLFLAPLDASSPARLLVEGNGYAERIGSDSARVVCLLQDSFNVVELFGVALAPGSVPVKLNAPLPLGSVIGDVKDFELDSGRVAYRVSIPGCCDGVSDELHVVSLDSYKTTQLLPSGGFGVGYEDDVRNYRFADDGGGVSAERLVFRLGGEEGEGYHLYSTSLDGGAPVLLSVRPESYFGATQYELLPGGERVVFQQDFNDVSRLFQVPTDGSAPPTELSGPLVASGEVRRFLLTPDGSRAVYVADQVTAGARELFVVPTDGSAEPVQLNDVPAQGGYPVFGVELTPDGTRAVYFTDQDVNDVSELYSVRLDGSASPVKLSAAMVAGGDVRENRLAAGRTVYLADQDADEVVELFSVPLDGSGPPVKLNAPLVAGGDVQASASSVTLSFLVSLDGSRVLYRADQERDDVIELYSAPLDGSSAPVRVNGPFPGSADVMAFHLGSGVVVYVADADVDETFELYSAPLDGSAAPVRLIPGMTAGGDVFKLFSTWQFQITADSKAVVYMADQVVDERVELFRVPIAGGGAFTRLNAGLVLDGDVASFRLEPDGEHVLYTADQDEDQVVELYRAAVNVVPRARAR